MLTIRKLRSIIPDMKTERQLPEIRTQADVFKFRYGYAGGDVMIYESDKTRDLRIEVKTVGYPVSMQMTTDIAREDNATLIVRGKNFDYFMIKRLVPNQSSFGIFHNQSLIGRAHGEKYYLDLVSKLISIRDSRLVEDMLSSRVDISAVGHILTKVKGH